MLHAKNDSQRIKDELVELRTKNKELFALALDIYHYAELMFDKDVIITMIERTQEEQDYLYRDSERYKKKKFKSPHQFSHAIDIRSRIYTEVETKQLTKYINDKYNESNYYKWTARVHTVGNNGIHYHIQYYKK